MCIATAALKDSHQLFFFNTRRNLCSHAAEIVSANLSIAYYNVKHATRAHNECQIFYLYFAL